MQFLTERHSGKTKQITNWSVLSFKGKLKFFRFKIVKYEIRAFKRKIEMNCLFCLRTFAPIVSAHPYCVRLHAQTHMPRHASSARQVLK